MKILIITLQNVTAKHNYAILIHGGVPMHTNSRLQALSAAQARSAPKAQRGKTNTQSMAKADAGPLVVALTALAVGFIMMKDHPEWAVFFWVSLGASMLIAYLQFGRLARFLIITASAVTAFAAITHVFSAWF